MSKPKAYDPVQGQKYQILLKSPEDRELEHLDYAKDNKELKFLIGEYRLAYPSNYYFRPVLLPKKYWEEPHHANCPAVDGFPCHCDGKNLEKDVSK